MLPAKPQSIPEYVPFPASHGRGEREAPGSEHWQLACRGGAQAGRIEAVEGTPLHDGFSEPVRGDGTRTGTEMPLVGLQRLEAVGICAMNTESLFQSNAESTRIPAWEGKSCYIDESQ